MSEFPTPGSFLLPYATAKISRRSAVFFSLSALTAAKMLGGQNPQEKSQPAPGKPDFSANVKVVNVFTTIRDKNGKIVKGLKKEDFTLLEEGRPQSLQYFSQQSDLPLTLGLLVDTSRSEARMLGTEREASRTFLEKVLREDRDKAFLIHFDSEIELLQDLTPSRVRLEKALDLLNVASDNRYSPPQSGGNGGGSGQSGGGGWGGQRGGGGGGWGGRGGGPGPGGGTPGSGGRRRGGGGTAFYDAIYLASNDVLKSQTGRKAVIMLTDGEDNASKISLAEAIMTAQRSDTLAYAIRIADDQNSGLSSFGGGKPGRRGGMGGGGRGRGPVMDHVDGKKVLREISDKTGASYYEYSKKKSLEEIYSEIEEELRNQYSLGYTSDRPETEAGFRKISVTVRDKKYQVRAREGYYAGVGT